MLSSRSLGHFLPLAFCTKTTSSAVDVDEITTAVAAADDDDEK